MGMILQKQNGRLTLNPFRHLDRLGTIMIFLVHFGWAKPVPVNPHNLNNSKKDALDQRCKPAGEDGLSAI
jgi:Zn-dependent protease